MPNQSTETELPGVPSGHKRYITDGVADTGAPRCDRRTFLKRVALVGAFGHRDPLPDNSKPRPESDVVRSWLTNRRANELEDAWRMLGHDAAHTGYNPAAREITEPLEVRWRFTAPADAVWSPVVVDDTVYAGSRDGNLYALDTATGEERWRVTVADRASIPAVDDDTVYVTSFASDGAVVAVDAETGIERWRAAVAADRASSPTVVGKTVFIGSRDSTVYALDTATGEIRWQFNEITNAAMWPPTVVDTTLYVGSWETNLYALDATTGEERWRFEAATSLVGSPTVVDGTVYFGSDDSNIYALDARTGQQRWRSQPGIDWKGGMTAVADGMVYVVGNPNQAKQSGEANLYALDTRSGEERWRVVNIVPPNGVETVAVGGGTVYSGSRSGTVYALDATTGAERWRFTHENEGVPSFTPTVVGNTAYIGTAVPDASLYAVTGAGDDQ